MNDRTTDDGYRKHRRLVKRYCNIDLYKTRFPNQETGWIRKATDPSYEIKKENMNPISILKKKTLRDTKFEFAILFTLRVSIGAKDSEVRAWANANLLEGVNPTVDVIRFVRHEYNTDHNIWNVTISGDHQFGEDGEI